MNCGRLNKETTAHWSPDPLALLFHTLVIVLQPMSTAKLNFAFPGLGPVLSSMTATLQLQSLTPSDREVGLLAKEIRFQSRNLQVLFSKVSSKGW